MRHLRFNDFVIWQSLTKSQSVWTGEGLIVLCELREPDPFNRKPFL
jgi:hypothetical protein